MAVAVDPIKRPSMERNVALAGKIVYSLHMNVRYNKRGYAIERWNPLNKCFEGTTYSLKGQPIEDALAGKPWNPPVDPDLRPWPGALPDDDDFAEEDADKRPDEA